MYKRLGEYEDLRVSCPGRPRAHDGIEGHAKSERGTIVVSE